MHKGFFITGIGTGVGKTIASAVIAEKLGADYWKPVQAGDLGDTDSGKVQSLLSNSRSKIHAERYRLTAPMSPHAAAAIDNIEINITDFVLPRTGNFLAVEGAGGALVPLNTKDTMTDLMEALELPVIIVATTYLGSINHTMLTIEYLRSRNIVVAGILFTGEINKESLTFILNNGGLKMLGNIPQLEEITKEKIRQAGEGLNL